MRYIVIPARKRNSYQSVCNSREQAVREKKKLEVLSGKEWTIIEVS